MNISIFSHLQDLLFRNTTLSFLPLPFMAIASLVGSGIKSAAASNLGSDQATRAKKTRNDANNIIAKPIANEFYDNKLMSENRYLSGLPGLSQTKSQISQQEANAVNQSRLSTNNSGDLLSAIASINNKTQDANIDLGIKDAAYKDSALDNVSLNNQAIAAAKVQQEALAQTERSKLRDASGALENAATANKNKAVNIAVSGANDAIGVGAGMGMDKKSSGTSPIIDANTAQTQNTETGVVLNGDIAIPEKTPEVDLEADLTPEQRTKLKGMINNGIDQGTINKYLLRVNAINAAEKEKNKTK